jgi:hypothetical protein
LRTFFVAFAFFGLLRLESACPANESVWFISGLPNKRKP